MKIKNAPKMIAFDTETTGLEAKEHRIVELAYILYENGEIIEKDTMRFNPEMSIPAVTSRIHGIYDKDVQNEPTFKDKAVELRELFSDDAIMVGYNILFDIKFLKEEFKRAGIKGFTGKNTTLDPMKIWKNIAPRHRLVDAHKVFVGGKFDNAHSALADIEATVSVLYAMLDKFNITPDVKAIATATTPDETGGSSDQVISGNDILLWADDGKIILNFGKHRGTELKKVDQGFLGWMVKKDFVPTEIKTVVQKVLDGKKLPVRGK